jgi:hypothetical protein
MLLIFTAAWIFIAAKDAAGRAARKRARDAG